MTIAGWRVFATALLGSLLLQAAWILVVPPFRGLDEHEHAYKAAAVVRGDFSADHPPSPLGWGELMVVPRDLVIAAEPECSDLPYTTTDNCTPGDDRGDGLVTVSSSAARYNPVFYAVTGLPSLVLHGTNALYGMRALAAVLCALLVAGAVLTTGRWATTVWPGVALLLTLTPVLTYSTAMLAPNGLELAAAVLLWTALLGFSRARDAVLAPRTVLVVAVVAAVPLALVRTLGPLWLAMIVLTAWALRPQLARLLLGTLAGRVATGVVAVATVAGAGWTLSAGTNDPGSTAGGFGVPTVTDLAASCLLWLFQSVAAFPARDELAPLPLYALALLAWWVLAALAFRVAGRRLRWVALAAILAAAVVPLTLTVLTFDALGTAWQGRYSYPFAMGIVLLAGVALDRAGTRGSNLPLLVAGGVLATLHAIGQAGVLAQELTESPLAGSSAWPAPPLWIVLTLSCTGATLLVLALHRSRPSGAPA